MDTAATEAIFDKHHAIVRNTHVIYTSGRHGSTYVNKDAIYPHTQDVSELCNMIAEHFVSAKPDIVIAPAIGGVILTQWTAHHLSTQLGYEALAVYAEKTPDGNFVIKRGYNKLLNGKRVLVVEDNLTTGGSVKKVVAATRQCGGEVVGVGALCNRGKVTTEMVGGVPDLFALLTLDFTEWEATDCPLCTASVPIDTGLGKGENIDLNKKQL